ncbi:MAG: hypothetical protein ACK2UJ_18415, partial [Candidatus Promineifilaceae bacterium]
PGVFILLFCPIHKSDAHPSGKDNLTALSHFDTMLDMKHVRYFSVVFFAAAAAAGQAPALACCAS